MSAERDVMKRFVMAAAILGFVAVALGAFGAHGLEKWLETLPDGAKRLEWWGTGVRYQMWHALLLLGIGLFGSRVDAPSLRASGWLCVAGVVLFSGSLYTMTLTGIRALGAVTPLGGLCFLAAWIGLFLAARRATGD
jgi:uncharacterized membrane protein YgdD (TMEM256/DUF423 family)